MKNRWILLLLACGLAPSTPAATRRLAVVVGNNAGASSRPPLRYAEVDAGKMARTLQEVGEVRRDDLLLLQGQGMGEVEAAFGWVKQAVEAERRRPEVRTVVLFYFSGHGDGEALELGKERLSFARLRALMASTDADVKLAVLDACHSGAAVGTKGVKAAPPFTVRLVDSLQVDGEAILSSSAANEAALESEELGGSFFTNHLVSGLRGAADESGDGRVTLAEAYRYAYERTVRATSLTLHGAQHPSFDVRLAGRGELVLSFLDRVVAKLVLPSGMERVLVTDLLRDQVVAELVQPAGRMLGLPAGRYAIRAVRAGKSLVGTVQLKAGERQELRWEALSAPVERDGYVSKGPAGPTSDRRKVRLSVVPFKNASGDPKLDALSVGLAETVVTDFGAHALVQLVERTQLEVDLKELDFSSSERVDPATRAKLGRLTGAEVVVLGAFQTEGRFARVNARFIHVETGEVLHALKVQKEQGQLLALQDELARELRRAVPLLAERLEARR